MVRSLTLSLIFCSAVAAATAQTPAQEQPAKEQPAAQQPAQQPAPPQPYAEPSQRPATPSAATPAQNSMANTVTYSGCLKPGATPGTWTLENAAIAAAGAATASPADRPVSTSGTATSKETLLLTAKPTDNLKPHANHKIEVTGVVSPSTDIASAPTPSPASPGAANTTTPAPRQTLAITSFKMVSATCP